jgi:hypothetical protein
VQHFASLLHTQLVTEADFGEEHSNKKSIHEGHWTYSMAEPAQMMLQESPAPGNVEQALTQPDSGQVLMPAGYKMPVIDIDPAKCHDQPEVDFSIEENILKFVRPNRWLSLDLAGHRFLRSQPSSDLRVEVAVCIVC